MSDAGSPSNAAETKPKADDNTLNIKIRATDGSEVFFKIKKTTKLNKLKNAYADRVGQDPGAIRLLFDGQRILDNATADDLDMEDGDVVDVLLEPQEAIVTRWQIVSSAVLLAS
ncbi:Small ubiquitin-related modifier 1 [Vanrija pseudolonga]|uniref:Small ubiquitin-related modifier 1 n=1 Tax=Vanrija pseudolonga TaxID=143232 RepID=A0AAF1BM15_9TREE|nr:Small ubiquitin-related modifier 1 [Vanrija pseudolonga]